MVPKLDRLTRRVVDLGLLIETYFAEAAGRWCPSPIRSTRAPPAGRMTLFILMSVAQWEQEAIGERTADALAHLRTEGVQLGRAAFGWQHTETTEPATGRRIIKAVETEVTVIGRIQVLRAGGASFAAIARQLTAEDHPVTQRGGRWLPNTVRRVWKRGAPHQLRSTE